MSRRNTGNPSEYIFPIRYFFRIVRVLRRMEVPRAPRGGECAPRGRVVSSLPGGVNLQYPVLNFQYSRATITARVPGKPSGEGKQGYGRPESGQEIRSRRELWMKGRTEEWNYIFPKNTTAACRFSYPQQHGFRRGGNPTPSGAIQLALPPVQTCRRGVVAT